MITQLFILCRKFKVYYYKKLQFKLKIFKPKQRKTKTPESKGNTDKVDDMTERNESPSKEFIEPKRNNSDQVQLIPTKKELSSTSSTRHSLFSDLDFKMNKTYSFKAAEAIDYKITEESKEDENFIAVDKRVLSVEAPVDGRIVYTVNEGLLVANMKSLNSFKRQKS